jgi:hypothetical protein
MSVTTNRLGIPRARSRARAIREKCLDCGNGSRKAVRLCTRDGVASAWCPLWPHRLGCGPETASRRFGSECITPGALPAADVPLVPQTRYMVSEQAIETMKPGVMPINTGRGGLVDTKALIDALKTGKIGAAGLDVYEEESEYFFEDFSDTIITDDVLARLLTFPNVMITSHQAFLTREALRNIAETTLGSIAEYEQGRRGAS